MSDPSESTSSSSSSSSSSPDEVSTPKINYRRIYCGLESVGKTCYSNACVQALFRLNKIRSLLIESRVTGGPFHVSLGKLFHEMNRPPQLCANISNVNIIVNTEMLPSKRAVKFNKQFRRAHPQFVLKQHHDAQQFLAFLLDILHKEASQAKSPLPYEPRNRDEAWHYQQTYLDPSPYAKIFMGQVEAQLSCNSCGHRSISWSCFWQLELYLPADPDEAKTLTVNDCIREFMADEMLRGNCAGCNQQNGFTKKRTVCQGPPYLIVHLKRFGPTGEKNDRKVSFDPDLSLANRHYMLTSCVMHRGTRTKGHYTTLFNEDSNRWVLFDDDEMVQTHITDRRARKMMQEFGYIGFYRAVVIG